MGTTWTSVSGSVRSEATSAAEYEAMPQRSPTVVNMAIFMTRSSFYGAADDARNAQPRFEEHDPRVRVAGVVEPIDLAEISCVPPPGKEMIPHPVVDYIDVVGLADDAAQLVFRRVEMPFAADDVDVFEPADGIELAEDVHFALLAIDFQKVDARQLEFLEELGGGNGVRKLPGAIRALEFVARINIVSLFAAIEAEYGQILRPSTSFRRVPHEDPVMLSERLEAVNGRLGEILRRQRGEASDVRTDVDDDPRGESGADEVVDAVTVEQLHLVANRDVDVQLARVHMDVHLAFTSVVQVRLDRRKALANRVKSHPILAGRRVARVTAGW